MQFVLARKRNSVKETPGADLLYQLSALPLTGVAPHSPAAGDGRCFMTGLLTVGDESFKVTFAYSDYNSEPSFDKTGNRYYIDVDDAGDTLHLHCKRIEQALANTTGDLSVLFDDASLSDTKPTFIIYAGDKQVGTRWTMQAPTKEELLYAVQRHFCRNAIKSAA